MQTDSLDIKQIANLLLYCIAHRNCTEACGKEMACESFVDEITEAAETKEFPDLNDEKLLVVIELREYCRECNRCTIRCEQKIECERLMWRIIADHKEVYHGKHNFNKETENESKV